MLPYRQLRSEEEKAEKYPHTHRWITRPWISYLVNLGALAVIGVTLTRSYQANINAYQWKQISNDFYYGFNKLAFVAAMMMLVLTILLGHGQTGKNTFQNSYVRAFGKLAYDAALVSPIVITFLYFGQEQSV